MPRYVTTNLRFGAEVYRELRYEAVRRRTTVAFLVREAVEQYFGRGEAGPGLAFGKDGFDKLTGAVKRSGGDESVEHDHYLYGWSKEEGVKLLADTSALLALTMRDDQHHARAAAFVRQNPQARFVLTDLIVSETATRVRARADARTAAAVAGELLRSKRYQVVFVDVDLLQGAIEQMQRFEDKRLSLVDCVSFEMMERLAVRSAFTFDRDFRDCGFEMVP